MKHVDVPFVIFLFTMALLSISARIAVHAKLLPQPNPVAKFLWMVFSVLVMAMLLVQLV